MSLIICIKVYINKVLKKKEKLQNLQVKFVSFYKTVFEIFAKKIPKIILHHMEISIE